MSVILITGCSSGIGLATAVHLAKAGHMVYATMRNPSNSLLPQLIKKELLPINILLLDVTNESSVQKAVQQVLDQEGHIDVLINNAGISALGPVEELPIEAFYADMETNYLGTVRCSKAVLPQMRARRKGTIINVTSIAGKIFNAAHSTYVASKAAVEAFSESLALEVASFGIQVAVVEPGVIDTPIFSKGEADLSQTAYPFLKRLLAFFAASLENHFSPFEVAYVIEDIIAGKRKAFRNPAGPDAAPLLEWRASLKDEDWIATGMIDDETWTNTMESMGLKVRPYMEDPSLIFFRNPEEAPLAQ
ncbi:MAG: SDR family oxidoreductase [Chitinophagaceae bacterium]|nr:MAG: SDR family oxidoreductase [Chitinophagaceae bacterium]